MLWSVLVANTTGAHAFLTARSQSMSEWMNEWMPTHERDTFSSSSRCHRFYHSQNRVNCIVHIDLIHHRIDLRCTFSQPKEYIYSIYSYFQRTLSIRPKAKLVNGTHSEWMCDKKGLDVSECHSSSSRNSSSDNNERKMDVRTLPFSSSPLDVLSRKSNNKSGKNISLRQLWHTVRCPFSFTPLTVIPISIFDVINYTKLPLLSFVSAFKQRIVTRMLSIHSIGTYQRRKVCFVQLLVLATTIAHRHIGFTASKSVPITCVRRRRAYMRHSGHFFENVSPSSLVSTKTMKRKSFNSRKSIVICALSWDTPR